MKLFVEIWNLLDRRQRRALIVLQLVSVVIAFSTVGGIAAILPFFTVLADPGAIARNTVLRSLYTQLHFSSYREFVTALGLGFAAVVLCSNAIALLGSLLINRLAFRVGDTLYTSLFEEYLNRNYEFHTRTSGSALSTKVVHETGRVTTGILQSGLVLITNLLTVAAIAGSILLVNRGIALAAIAGLAFGYLALYVVARRRLLRNGIAESRAFSQRGRTVSEGFGGIREIKLADAQELFAAKFECCCRSISETIVNTLTIAQSPKYILESATVCALVFVALYSTRRVGGDTAWMAQLSFVALAAYRLLPALQQAFAALVRIRSDRPAFASVAADLRKALARGSRDRTLPPGPSWSGKPVRDIRLEGISFEYASEGGPAVVDLSLRIQAGTTIGFSGANGSGKTTLLDIVAGLLVPSVGTVWVDGVALDDANRRQWRAAVAYVSQQIFLFDATFAQNIALGVPAAQIDYARLLTAARLAQLEECVMALPNRYEEVLGERGARLSGGQRQRLGIARALYRDASLIILDEATSALDARAEEQIVEMFATLGGKRTVLISAHRPAALKYCEAIFPLENGRLLRAARERTAAAR